MKRVTIKKLSRALLLSAVLVMAAYFAGCTTRLGAFTMISTKNMDFSRMDEYKRNNQRVSGKDEMFVILFFPTKGNITVQEAVDKAIEAVPGGVAVIDAVMRYEYLPMFFFSQSAYVIEGTVLVDPKLAALYRKPEGATNYLALTVKSNGEYTRKYISKEDYEKLSNK